MAKNQAATHRLSKETRDEITTRVLVGEKAAALAIEFGVSPAYVSLLKATALDPERFKRKAEAKLSLKLTAQETEELKQVFATSTPADNDLIPARKNWTLEHGFQMAWKLFSKKPSVRGMKECMGGLLKRRSDPGDPKPQPPQPIRFNQINPELAKDPSYVAYVQSPIYQKIAQKEYEMALAEWERRHPDGEESVAMLGNEEPVEDIADSRALPSRSFAQPSGKHSKGKGSPFTPPKKRRKKR